MRLRANVLLSIGTILATLGGARLPEVQWLLVGIGAAVLIAGGVLHHLANRKPEARQRTAESGAAEALRDLSDDLQSLVHASASLSLAELVDRLGELELGAMARMAEAIPEQLALLGGARFAEIYGEYAAGERLVHRAWSAAADGHREEALRSLEAGAAQIHAALLRTGEAPAAPASVA